MDRKKIIIIGCPGSGKSTFARRLHDVTGLPIYHLDNLFWKADRTHISRDDELDPELVEMVQQYETQNKPLLQDLFRKYPKKEVITFYNRDEAMKWLASEYNKR